MKKHYMHCLVAISMILLLIVNISLAESGDDLEEIVVDSIGLLPESEEIYEEEGILTKEDYLYKARIVLSSQKTIQLRNSASTSSNALLDVRAENGELVSVVSEIEKWAFIRSSVGEGWIINIPGFG